MFKTPVAVCRDLDVMSTATPASSTRTHLDRAAAVVASMLRDVDTADLDAPTPCVDWDLRTLVQHAAGTTTGLAKLGRRQELGADPWAGPDLPEETWNLVLAERIEALAEAWTAATAWEGTVRLGAEMPARTIGDMAYAEILLHGWDVARAVGAELDVPAPLAAALRGTVVETAGLGRQTGAYGPQVEVADDAGDFERALGAAGRDPRWVRPS